MYAVKWNGEHEVQLLRDGEVVRSARLDPVAGRGHYTEQVFVAHYRDPTSWLAEKAEAFAERTQGHVPRCGFCKKRRDEVERLIAGAQARICDACIVMCHDMLGD